MLIAGYAVVVATAPTVHGIETEEGVNIGEEDISKLQQHLSFTVLKLMSLCWILLCFPERCNSTYRSRY